MDADVGAGGGDPGRADDRGRANRAESATGATAPGSIIDVAYLAQLAYYDAYYLRAQKCAR